MAAKKNPILDYLNKKKCDDLKKDVLPSQTKIPKEEVEELRQLVSSLEKTLEQTLRAKNKETEDLKMTIKNLETNSTNNKSCFGASPKENDFLNLSALEKRIEELEKKFTIYCASGQILYATSANWKYPNRAKQAYAYNSGNNNPTKTRGALMKILTSKKISILGPL